MSKKTIAHEHPLIMPWISVKDQLPKTDELVQLILVLKDATDVSEGYPYVLCATGSFNPQTGWDFYRCGFYKIQMWRELDIDTMAVMATLKPPKPKRVRRKA